MIPLMKSQSVHKLKCLRQHVCFSNDLKGFTHYCNLNPFFLLHHLRHMSIIETSLTWSFFSPILRMRKIFLLLLIAKVLTFILSIPQSSYVTPYQFHTCIGPDVKFLMEIQNTNQYCLKVSSIILLRLQISKVIYEMYSLLYIHSHMK